MEGLSQDISDLTVLLVEDDVVDAEAARRQLRQTMPHSTVIWKKRLAPALEHLGEGGIDVVLLDLHLPDSQGIDTLTAVHEKRPGIPVVVLSGQDDETLSVEAVRRGAQDYVVKKNLAADLLGRTLRYAVERKRIEEELRREKKRAQQYLDVAGTMLVALDPVGRVTMINQAGRDLLGYAEDEIVGKDWFDLVILSWQRNSLRKNFTQLLEGNGDDGQEVESYVSTRTGDAHLIAWKNTILRDEHGQIVGTLSSGMDVTESRWTEAALQESEARFRTVVESLPMALVMVDRAGTITLVNEQVESWFGYDRDELIGQPVEELVPEAVQAGHRATRTDYLQAPEARMMGKGRDLYARRKDSSMFPVEVGLTPIKMEEGIHILATIIDITLRKEAQAALQASEELHRVTLSNISEAVFITDDAGAFTYICPNVETTFGYTSEEVAALGTISNLIGDGLFGPEVLEGQVERRNLEWEVETKDGQKRALLISVKPVNIAQGTILFTCRDITDRKQAEELLVEVQKALQQSERWHRALVQETFDGIFLYDAEGVISYASPAVMRITGYSLDELVGEAMHGFVVEEDLPALNKKFQALIGEPGEPLVTEHRLLHKDGSPIWVEGKLTNLLHHPDIASIVFNFRNITERKQAERKLVESNTRFANLAANLPGMIFQYELGPDGTPSFVYASSGSLSLLRVSPQALLDDASLLARLMPPEDYKRLEASIRLSAQTMQAWHYEGRALVDGDIKWLQGRSRPRRLDDGTILWDGLLIDVTARKQAEADLHESEARLRFALKAARMGTWELDVQTNTVHWSDHMTDLFAMKPGQFDGRLETVRAQIYPEDRAAVREALQQTLEKGGEYEMEFRVPHPDGSFHWMTGRGRIFYNEEGAPKRIGGVVMDITERKAAEAEVLQLNEELEARVRERTAQLKAVNKELEAFSYSASHDLRAPLRTIEGFSRILIDSFADELPPKAQHYLQRIRYNALHMDELVGGLLRFSRMSRQTLRKTNVEPRLLVEEVLDNLLTLQNDRDIHVEIGPLPRCEADPILLKQVFANLLSNALKYTRARDTAQIEVGTQQGTHVPVYYVADNGVGFDMQYAHKLFGVFQRLHRAEDFEGTGVGLALVQRIIHRHGGEVWAEAAPGKGATFYFTLSKGHEHDR